MQIGATDSTVGQKGKGKGGRKEIFIYLFISQKYIGVIFSTARW